MTTLSVAHLLESVVDTVGERLALVAGGIQPHYRPLDVCARGLSHRIVYRTINSLEHSSASENSSDEKIYP